MGLKQLYKSFFRKFSSKGASSSSTQKSVQARSMASAMAAITALKAPLPLPDDIADKKHHLKNGRFANPWPSWHDMEIFKSMKYMANARWTQGPPKTGEGHEVEVVKPDFPTTRSSSDGQFRATWLGHACFYVEFPGGFRVLFDPVFCNRCSPSQIVGPARYTKAPCEIEDIPVIDAVVISHAHYDHLDLTTVMKINKKHPNVQFFAPLNNKAWFAASGIPNCTELDWWDSREMSISIPKGSLAESSHGETATATMSCLPCQHTANRGIWDRNATLWASWSVASGGRSVYFAGDTGYRAVPMLPADVDDYGEDYKDLPICPAFKEIGNLRGPFDLGLIPIGAYSPRWVMSPMHANPFDSVNIFIDTKCKKALGMHWGTWILTDEPVLEPPRKLKEALKKNGLAEEGVFDVVACGEAREF